MSATSFFGGAFFGGEFFNTPSAVVVDTHDGFDSNIKRDEEYRSRKERLRTMLEQAIDPQAYPVPQETLELAAPFTERLESGRVEIDWAKLERENVIRAQLYAAAAEYERQAREFEEDEEDVLNLLLH